MYKIKKEESKFKSKVPYLNQKFTILKKKSKKLGQQEKKRIENFYNFKDLVKKHKL